MINKLLSTAIDKIMNLPIRDQRDRCRRVIGVSLSTLTDTKTTVNSSAGKPDSETVNLPRRVVPKAIAVPGSIGLPPLNISKVKASSPLSAKY